MLVCLFFFNTQFGIWPGTSVTPQSQIYKTVCVCFVYYVIWMCVFLYVFLAPGLHCGLFLDKRLMVTHCSRQGLNPHICVGIPLWSVGGEGSLTKHTHASRTHTHTHFQSDTIWHFDCTNVILPFFFFFCRFGVIFTSLWWINCVLYFLVLYCTYVL